MLHCLSKSIIKSNFFRGFSFRLAILLHVLVPVFVTCRIWIFAFLYYYRHSGQIQPFCYFHFYLRSSLQAKTLLFLFWKDFYCIKWGLIFFGKITIILSYSISSKLLTSMLNACSIQLYLFRMLIFSNNVVSKQLYCAFLSRITRLKLFQIISETNMNIKIA